MAAQEVAVEVRLWACDPENHLVRIPVAEHGVLTMDHPECTDNEPVLVVDDEAYGPATEEAFACVLLVLEEPTKEETELLLLAAEVGYVIEPRMVGKAWRYMEEGNFFPLGPPIEPGGLLGEG